MAKALGIVTSGNRIKVEGMQAFRPVSAFTFVGRYRYLQAQIPALSLSMSAQAVTMVSTASAARSSFCSHLRVK